MTPERREVLLAFADDEHLMGQRHTEWIGVAPFLEEDLAFSSIAQDELGHAVLLYELVVDRGAADRIDVDTFAFERDRDEWRSCRLVEEPCTEWADALVRHWIYDTAERFRWEALIGWDDDAVGAVAARALREEAYHRRHADALLDALVDDPDACGRLRASLDRLLPLAAALFDHVTPDGAPPPAWRAEVDRRFGPRDRWAPAVERSTRLERSEHFDVLLARMREVFDIDPSARW